MGVDLVDATEAHGERGGAEVLEGELETFPVEREGRVRVLLQRRPKEISHSSSWLVAKFAVF